MASAEHNNEEWQQKLIGKTLVEDNVETTLGAEQVKTSFIDSCLFTEY